jgi:hypothetical protein
MGGTVRIRIILAALTSAWFGACSFNVFPPPVNEDGLLRIRYWGMVSDLIIRRMLAAIYRQLRLCVEKCMV